MNVVKVLGVRPGEPAVRLVDDDGEPVAEVDGLLRLLAVREYSPNTIRAYAHDLRQVRQHFPVRPAAPRMPLP